MYTRNDIANDLRNLGLAGGDIVLVRAALKATGAVDGIPAQTLIGALLDVIGGSGTILGLSHTATSKPSEKEAVFRRDTPCVSGGFAAALLDWKGSYRSRHPTNSIVAIGHDAESLLRDHDETSTCFGPMRKLVDAGAKMVLVGCVESSPGFSTVHLVYEDLNLADKSTLSGLYGSYYEKDGQIRWFSKKDVPGCSMGFGKLYPVYRQRGVLVSGKVGDAESLLIKARDAYAIEYDVISRDPTAALCDRPSCFSCRGTKLFNVPGMLRYYATRPHKLPRLLRATLRRRDRQPCATD